MNIAHYNKQNTEDMPEKELSRLHTVKRFLQLEISKEAELQHIVELAARICGSPIAMITFMDSETQHVKFRVGTDITEVPYQNTFCQHTILQKELLIIPDATADERVSNNPFVCNDPSIRFYAGSPLTTDDDQNMGTLCVFDIQVKTLTSLQEKMLQRLARQVTRLLEFEASLHLLKDQYEDSLVEETKLRSFFESSTSCHLLLDKELRVLSFNKALAEIMSKTYCLPITEGINIQECVHPGFLNEFTYNCNKALNGETVKTESIVASPEGDISWYITYEPAFDSEGSIIGVSYTSTDITQTVRHEKMLLEQEESFRQIDHILSAELHQPLAVVTEAMANLKLQNYPDHLIEFVLLEKAFEELNEKRKVILA